MNITFATQCVTFRKNYEDESKDYIELTGTTQDGDSIKVDIPFQLYFLMELPSSIELATVDDFIKNLYLQVDIEKFVAKYEFMEKLPARPFHFYKTKKLLKFCFDKIDSHRSAFELLKAATIKDGSMGFIMWNDKPYQIIMFENTIKPVERFCQTQLNSCGWMKCNNYEVINEFKSERQKLFDLPASNKVRLTSKLDDDFMRLRDITTNLHIKADLPDIELVDEPRVPEHTVLVCDIETKTLDRLDEVAEIYKISFHFYDTKTNMLKMYLVTTIEPHCLKRKNGYEILYAKNEKVLLELFVKYFKILNPDVVCWHNGFGFDCGYILMRANYHKIKDYEYLGRTGLKNANESSKMMSKEVQYTEFKGRLQVDTMFFLMGFDKQLISYSLQSTSEEFLTKIKKDSDKPLHQAIHNAFKDADNYEFMMNNQKGDVEGEEITNYFISDDESKRQELSDYCVKDSLLTLRLYIERLMYIKVWKMGSAFRAPCQVVLTGGTGERVMPNILTYIHNEGMFFNKYHDDELDPYRELWVPIPYDGGLVREPIPGRCKFPVAVYDANSMYPSNMMEYNLCFQTILPVKRLTPEQKEQLKNIKHIVKTVSLKGKTEDLIIIQEDNVGYSYKIEKKMMVQRNISKKKLKEAKEKKQSDLESAYDAEQLAYKIYMNGFYGLYAPKMGGRFTYPLVAAAITQYSREYALRAGEFILKHPLLKGLNPKIVYGDTDSVFIMWGDENIVYKSDEEMLKAYFKVGRQLELDLNASFVATSRHGEDCYLISVLEKVFLPLILWMVKKYYAGQMWNAEFDKKTGDVIELIKGKAPIVGIEGKKRDRCEHLRQLQMDVVKIYLTSSQQEMMEKVHEKVYNSLMEVATNKVPLNKLVIVKNLKLDVKEYASQTIPHVAVAKQNAERGEDCKRGNRISYIVYTDKNKYSARSKKELKEKTKVYLWSQDYKTAMAKKSTPDCKYYIEQHYKNAMKKLAEPLGLDFKKTYQKIDQVASRNANPGQNTIMKMFGVETKDTKPKIMMNVNKPKQEVKQAKFSFTPTKETVEITKKRKNNSQVNSSKKPRH